MREPFLYSFELEASQGLPAFNDLLRRGNEAVHALRQAYADGTLPLLRLPETTSDLEEIQSHAARIRNGATDVVILGTGGSSLGAQALCQLADYGVSGAGAFRDGPRLHFMDNLDPVTFSRLLEKLPLSTSRFVAVSKSGGTGETLMQSAAVITALQQAGLNVSDHVTLLSEPEKPGKVNALRALFAPCQVPSLEHHTGVGGRFSVLTNVGLLPAAIAGLNISAIREGAAAVLRPILESEMIENLLPLFGAVQAVSLAEQGKTISVMLSYADRLEKFSKWYVQLWAESLGKQGRGTTPLAAMGPVDQHSQLQLFIDGPKDKFFTILTVGIKGKGPQISPELAQRMKEPGFAGKTIGDLVAAQGRATADTLAKHECPVRSFHIETLDEYALGALLMHLMLETILAATLLKVDPYDQPAVEEGKILARTYLVG